VKKCIFHSFPPKWQQQFIHSGQHVATMPLSDIIEFMSNEKSFADAQESICTSDKKKTPSKENNGETVSFKKRKQSNKYNTPQKKKYTGNFHPPTNDDECPIHW
jgi:hypothetical protein